MPRLDRFWNSLNPVSLLLAPVSVLFGVIVMVRRALYRIGALPKINFAAPIIVVGNITVGGTGKTPLVVWLAAHLAAHGWRPGIVSRGYGGAADDWPQAVDADSDPNLVGDEPVMLARRTGCPMSVGPDRPAAAEALLANAGVDIIIADDGMQHYALGRDLEIAVIDGERRFGNGLMLPAGPLREPVARLRHVDMVIVNGEGGPDEYSMVLQRPRVHGLHNERQTTLDSFTGRRVHAIAGIGNPERFFRLLQAHGIDVDPHPFPDHHQYSRGNLIFATQQPVLMTEKDAVKCRGFDLDDAWAVLIDAQPDAAFVDRLDAALKELSNG